MARHCREWFIRSGGKKKITIECVSDIKETKVHGEL
jgi:hypothetical protein